MAYGTVFGVLRYEIIQTCPIIINPQEILEIIIISLRLGFKPPFKPSPNRRLILALASPHTGYIYQAVLHPRMRSLPSGKLSHNELERSTMLWKNWKLTFDWAMT